MEGDGATRPPVRGPKRANDPAEAGLLEHLGEHGVRVWAGLGPAKLPADVLELGHGRTDHRGCPVQGAAAHDAGDGTPADLAAVAALGKTQAPPPKTATFQKAPPPLFVPPAQQEEAKPPPPLHRRRPAPPSRRPPRFAAGGLV